MFVFAESLNDFESVMPVGSCDFARLRHFEEVSGLLDVTIHAMCYRGAEMDKHVFCGMAAWPHGQRNLLLPCLVMVIYSL